MVKISVGGYDDGEGPSNRNQKRRREEEEEEDHQPQQSFEIVDHPSIATQEHEDHPAPPNDGGSNANTNASAATNGRDRSIPIFVSDPDVLDCCICYEPLNAPVFQCENGHIACSSCCVRLRNKCPMCLMPIGYNRCRAIEKVLDSIKMSCPNANYGCKETFSYSRKNDHEKECIYLPCLCPLAGCDFVASSKELFLHFSHRHVGFGTQFQYDKFFTVILSTDQKTTVLQEKNDANLFVVHNNHEHLGNVVRISCIGPKSMAEFQYEVLARFRGSTLILQSFAKITQGQFADAPPNAFLLIPSGFFGSRPLKLDIRIKSQH
ncbi:E3 ubiquitin-protein ligase SINA-like 10 [Cajanus cajan]|uniref:RING-type E3 ubiquitin transferase n=1 Tax=Cajanus cajan TaxID=3821 RepID=A0A151RZG6_CAJCA|nr:E3 ubiquitin-protein ligase SINA-like 10 [Cajanus cajan]KYP47940.1 E3 ubiquitin-protein ligase SINA-like 10 [Cajanus cajan]